jgi:hypothetical protein
MNKSQNRSLSPEKQEFCSSFRDTIYFSSFAKIVQVIILTANINSLLQS